MFNVTIKSDDDLLNLPSINQESVLLLDSEVSFLSSHIFLQMPSVKKLFIYGGSVPVAFVGANLRKMVLFKANTENLVIDSAVEYDLQTLIVAYGKLREVPPNLSALAKLEKLGLVGNEIESINMKQFEGLVKLRKLSLFGNRIKQVYSSFSVPISLPSLEAFAINDNQLELLSFTHWKAPSLEIMLLHNNWLYFVEALLGTFPTLEKVSLRGNPLNCQWKEWILGEFKKHRVGLYDWEMLTCGDGTEKFKVEETFQRLDLKLDQIFQQIQKLHNGLEQGDHLGDSEEDSEDEDDSKPYDELDSNPEISYF